MGSVEQELSACYHLLYHANVHVLRIWSAQVLGSPRWWLALALTVIPWLIWWRLRKPESADRLLYVGLLVMLCSAGMDTIGTSYDRWHYYYELIPLLPAYVPWDLSVIPVTVMWLIQTRPRSPAWIKGVIFSLGATFLGEPFARWADLYHPEHWRPYESLPLFFLLYIIADFASRRNHFSPL